MYNFLFCFNLLIPSIPWSVNGSKAQINFKDITPGNSSVLPIILKSFTLKNSGVNDFILEWVTASETNNLMFYIERQADTIGENWEIIDSVLSKAIKGNSQSDLLYSYTDKNLTSGTYYYRLVLIHTDGTNSPHPQEVWGIISEYEPIMYLGNSMLWLNKKEFYQIYDVNGRKVQEGNSREVSMSGKARGGIYFKAGKESF